MDKHIYILVSQNTIDQIEGCIQLTQVHQRFQETLVIPKMIWFKLNGLFITGLSLTQFTWPNKKSI